MTMKGVKTTPRKCSNSQDDKGYSSAVLYFDRSDTEFYTLIEVIRSSIL